MSAKANKKHPSGKRTGPAVSGKMVRALRMHSDFACANCAMCCTTPWPLPIERETFERLKKAVETGQVRSPKPAKIGDLLAEADGSLSVIGAHVQRDEQNRCLFLEVENGNLCAIHRQGGSDLLGLTCLLFPRLCVITPRGVFLSLSHFCPTAAELLFREDQTIAESIEPVVDPSAYPRDGRYAGLDARTHRPPLLRPDAPISWEGYALWERHTLDFISQERFTPEEALILLATTAEKLRAWKGVGSPSVEYLQQVFRQEFAMEGDTVKEQIAQLPTGALQGLRAYQLFFSRTEDETCALRVVREAFDHAYEGLTPEEVDRRFLADYGQLLAPFWAQFQGPVRRYLASRLHANYFAYQGKGLRTGLWAVISCLTALRVHAVLVCLSQNGPLDRSRLREAFRLTDFLISHSFRRDWLAQHFSQIENRSFMDLIGSVPL